jgi:tripartite ATP-independent transporter DctP family solute receptor
MRAASLLVRAMSPPIRRRGGRPAALAVAAVLIAGGLQLQAAPPGKPIVAKLADILSPEHPHTRTWQFFAAKVKEKTAGRVEIQVAHSAQLGQTKELYQSVQMGSIQMAKIPTAFASEWIPEVKVFDLPYLFADRAELWRVLKSPVGDRFRNEIYGRQGMVGLLWVDDGCRSVYARQPVRRPEDLAGQKIRVQPSEIQIEALQAMGGIPTPMAFGEVYLALQQKVLDGAENSPVLFWTSKHWEVSKVYSLTEQFWSVSTLVVNRAWWNKLPEDVQGQIRAAATAAEGYFLEIYTADEAKALDQLKGKGVEIVTDVDRAAFRARVLPVYEKFVRKNGSELLEQVKAAKGVAAAPVPAPGPGK